MLWQKQQTNKKPSFFQLVKGNRNYFHAVSQWTSLVPLQKPTYFRQGRNQLERPGKGTHLQTPFQVILSVHLEVIHELQKMLNMLKAAVTPSTFSTVLTWEKKDLGI